MKISRLVLGSVVVSSLAARVRSIQPAVFVSNNVGDSVTSFTVNPDGSLNRIAAFPSSDGPQTVSLSPDGRFSRSRTERSRQRSKSAHLQGQPRRDAHAPHDHGARLAARRAVDEQRNLAVTQTARRTRMFEYNASGNTFNQIDLEPSGLFRRGCTTRRRAYALRQQHDSGRASTCSPSPSGQLTFVEREPVSFAVDMAATHNGNFSTARAGSAATGTASTRTRSRRTAR